MRHRLLVVDGYSLLYRAFYGVPALTTSQGTPTNGVYGFANMLLRLRETPGTSALVVVFDAPSRTFRHEADATYKANRPPTPDELSIQIPLAHELVAAFNFPILMTPGVEADDVIGSLARRAPGAGWDITIVTSDADACQLVNDRVQVLCPRRGIHGGTELSILDEAMVRDRYGIDPDRLPEWKALCGDASDNIPGVPGIGPKTATALLQQFASLQEMYARLEEISNIRKRKILEDHRERILLSHHLATIDTGVDLGPNLEQSLEEWRVSTPDYRKLEDLFTRLEFRSLLRKIARPVSPRSIPPGPAVRDYGEITARELRKFLNVYLDTGASRPVAFHLEESSRFPPMLAISPAPGLARFLPASEFDGAREILEDPTVPKCLHNLKDMLNRLAVAGIELDGVAADTAVASYLLNPGRGRRLLNEVAFECLGVDLTPPRAQLSLFDDPSSSTNRTCHALCLAADSIGQIYDTLMPRVGEDRLTPIFETLEMPLAPVLAEMERTGIAVDQDNLKTFSRLLGDQMASLEQAIYTLAGYPFTIHSPRQLQQVLFGKLQLPRGRATRTGFSTDAETLKALGALHPLPVRVLEYRELARLKSDYVDTLPRLIQPETGRLHPRLSQTATPTGRLSIDPNLHEISGGTPMGQAIRRVFVADPGRVLLSVDYAQLELRILAHCSGDLELLRAFREGKDVHAMTAAALFDVSLNECTPEMRQRAKTLHSGLIAALSRAALAAELGLSRSQTEVCIERYFERFPGVKAFMTRTLREAQQRGYVSTLLGRRRYLPEIHSRKQRFRQAGERAAVSVPIQGTAADLIKLVLIRTAAELRQRGLQARIILQVHDAILIELPPGEVAVVLPMVRRIMETALPDVPLVVDACVGPNWGEMQPEPELAARSNPDVGVVTFAGRRGRGAGKAEEERNGRKQRISA